MNRLFGSCTQAPERGGSPAGRLWSPAVDVAENQDEIVLRAETGMRLIDIEATGDTLTLRGERKLEGKGAQEPGPRGALLRQVRSARSLGIPVQHDAVRANYKDGILEVHLPKSEGTKPRKVQVNASAG